MTINDFNTKINLPALIKDGIIDGPKNGIFTKVPKFGWFVRDPKSPDDVRNLTMIVKPDETREVYKDLLLHKTEYHEPRITYSETSFNRLIQNVFRYQTFGTFYFRCIQEADTGSVYQNGKYKKFKEGLIDQGHGALIENGVGLCSAKLLQDWNEKQNIKIPVAAANKLIFPTFCAPDFPVSLEYATFSNLENRNNLYVLEEKGWFGRLKNKILSSPHRMMYEVGFTWDKKANFWLDETVEIDQNFTTRKALEVWKEAKSGIFIEGQDPLTLIESRGEVDEIKQYLKSLKFHQVEALQKRFGEEFIRVWQNIEEDTIRLGKITFTMTPSGIDMVRADGERDEYTNFSFIVEKYVRRKKKVYRVGTLGFQGHFIPFELDNDLFATPKTLMNAIYMMFFDNQLGIPIILNQFQCYLIDVINRFSRHATFEQED